MTPDSPDGIYIRPEYRLRLVKWSTDHNLAMGEIIEQSLDLWIRQKTRRQKLAETAKIHLFKEKFD